MKRLSPSSHAPRYKGGIRHFHRPKARRSSWEQWIDGEARDARPGRRWVKILGIGTALVVLGGIIAGLILALGHS